MENPSHVHDDFVQEVLFGSSSSSNDIRNFVQNSTQSCSSGHFLQSTSEDNPYSSKRNSYVINESRYATDQPRDQLPPPRNREQNSSVNQSSGARGRRQQTTIEDFGGAGLGEIFPVNRNRKTIQTGAGRYGDSANGSGAITSGPRNTILDRHRRAYEESFRNAEQSLQNAEQSLRNSNSLHRAESSGSNSNPDYTSDILQPTGSARTVGRGSFQEIGSSSSQQNENPYAVPSSTSRAVQDRTRLPRQRPREQNPIPNDITYIGNPTPSIQETPRASSNPQAPVSCLPAASSTSPAQQWDYLGSADPESQDYNPYLPHSSYGQKGPSNTRNPSASNRNSRNDSMSNDNNPHYEPPRSAGNVPRRSRNTPVSRGEMSDPPYRISNPPYNLGHHNADHDNPYLNSEHADTGNHMAIANHANSVAEPRATNTFSAENFVEEMLQSHSMGSDNPYITSSATAPEELHYDDNPYLNSSIGGSNSSIAGSGGAGGRRQRPTADDFGGGLGDILVRPRRDGTTGRSRFGGAEADVDDAAGSSGPRERTTNDGFGGGLGDILPRREKKTPARSKSVGAVSKHKKIRSLQLRKGNKHIGDDCAFCLNEFEARQQVQVLPCSHCFHVGCWKKHVIFSQKKDDKAVRCPLCREDVSHLV